MDLKVLTAVFVSLTAIATGINSGSIQPSDIRSADMNSLNDLQNVEQPRTGSLTSIFSSIEPLAKLFQNPEPDKNMKAIVTSGLGESLRLRKASINASNFTEYRSETLNIESDEPIFLKGFSGTVSFGNNTVLQGRASGYRSSGVNVTQGIQVQTNMDSERVDVAGVKRAAINFQDVTVQIEADSTSTTVRNSSMRINSFSGDITVYPFNNTFILDGKVARLRAGDIVLE